MITTFWSWFWKGKAGGQSGLLLVFSWSLLIHVLIALALLAFVRVDPFIFAAKVLLPAASILVSMAIAWTSRAGAILQDVDFRSKVIDEENPLEPYVYGYQLSILIIIIMVVYVAIMASGGLNFVILSNDFSVKLSGFWLYFLLSFSISQCWQIIDFSNLLTLLHQTVRRAAPDSDKK